MPSPSQFKFFYVEATYRATGVVDRVLALTIACGCCGQTSECRTEDLLQLPGGVIVRCGRCGRHEAFSNAKAAACLGAPQVAEAA
jgi:hypothetical protein